MNSQEYHETELYKRLNAIRESVNDLHNQCLELLRPSDKPILIFDPFTHDSLTGLTETNYLMGRDKLVGGCSFLTNQMGLLELADYGEETIYIINNKSELVEIENGKLDICKEIRPAHNLFRMWRSGGLGAEFK